MPCVLKTNSALHFNNVNYTNSILAGTHGVSYKSKAILKKCLTQNRIVHYTLMISKFD